MFRSLRFRLPALFLAGILLSGIVATATAAFSDEVGALEEAGTLDKDIAKTLDDVVRQIDKALREEDPQKVSDETDKLVEEYDKGVSEGTIPPEGTQRLDPLLQDLTGAVDAYAG